MVVRMVSLLAHPFRITPRGACATVEQDSDDHYNQLLRVIVDTVQGERDMATGFGLLDPVWRGVFVEDIQAQCDTYGPPVTITDLDTIVVGETEQVRQIAWTR